MSVVDMENERLEAPLLRDGGEATEEPRDAFNDAVPTSIRWKLYVSHFLSTWQSRLFEFQAVITIAVIFPGNLLQPSIYALIRGLAAVLLAPAAGKYIDRTDRLKVVRLSIGLQRIPVALSCLCFWILLTWPTRSGPVTGVLMSALAVLACVEKVSSIMNTIAVERDWVVVIAGQHEPSLQALNSQTRRMDLIAKLLAPLAISFIDASSTRLAVLVTLGMNIVSLFIEYFAIAMVYNAVPELQRQDAAPVEEDKSASTLSYVAYVKELGDQLISYTRHPMFLPSFSLALLHFTVLSFAGHMVAYLRASSFSTLLIAALRTVSVTVEISATWFAPFAMRKVGPIRAGLWSITWQSIALVGAVGLFHGMGNSGKGKEWWGAFGLIVGVIVSRLGLWGFDLCAQTLIQEEVEGDARGSFSSSEAAFQNFFELLSYVMTIVFSRPEQFGYPATASAVVVLVAAALFALFVRRKRGHLLHVLKCVEKRQHGRDRGRQQETVRSRWLLLDQMA
ncbi:hypothetical protein SAICODRAFT_72386 [Saitoella complicata NRRL Y-17804]|uniref:Solute carrier family 40 member n=1 Tax=Saitoella complicata (strain BCRC 22490 / CBS 7301 / JCM 7358 / NBRC 10748 / NRRL Y-17804) TaxID=698492 RepID=A0A0E9NLQ5_SAICN|nr:uncharacterized protein SAICODRAFT_72386 [Saitoella complicata NRRL Y-17804]ODQ51770.1 hypothetical protein SAICODRAFT_72386 [Saitoella complicata NRRL Y-17804]GAO50611.1 hypothetical protein G7K_4735-t1 [Saitoella complicata NRRL Y-17804]